MSDPKPQSEPSMEEILATVRRIIADDESGAGPAAPPRAPSIGSDVLELTEALQPDGSVRHLPPFGSRLGGVGESRFAPPSDARVEPTPPAASLSEAASEPEKPAALFAVDEPREPEIAAAAFAETPAEDGEKSEPKLGAGERTLEDIVRDTLRPMVQKWLDENLPGLVEREVRAEIARTARDAAAVDQQPATRRRTRRSIPE
jgi:cell pole-organizing protein PopZ